MQKLTEENKKQIIEIINQYSKQRDKKITQDLYNLFFIEQVKDLYQKYSLQDFEIKQNGQVPFERVFLQKNKK